MPHKPGTDVSWLDPYKFKKGQSGNPGGVPKHESAYRSLPKLDKDSYNRLLNHTLSMTKEELEEVINDPQAPAIKIWLAKIVQKGGKFGDTHRLEALLARAIGPVAQKIEHTGLPQAPDQTLIQIAVNMAAHAKPLPERS